MDITRLELCPEGYSLRRYGAARWLGLAALFAITACGGKSRSDSDAAGDATAMGGGGAEAAAGGSPAASGSSTADAGTPAAAGSVDDGEGGAAGHRTATGEAGAGGDSPACLSGLVPDGTSFRCTAPSCLGLAKTCGSNGTADCCASPVVTGSGSTVFYRSYDGVGFTSQADPAQISDFQLDTLVVTLGATLGSRMLTLQRADAPRRT